MNLQPETRCDFYIDTKRKELWNTQLDIYQELKRVCDKYNLKVFAAYGTLLGLIRHKGFIPWDDDIDVFMLREDYEKLKAIDPKEWKEGYFFQNSYTDNLFRQHAQIRKDNTTMLLDRDYRKPYHRGVFIDIFILDNCPSDEEELKAFYTSIKEKYGWLFKPPFKKIHSKKNKLVVFAYNHFFYYFHKIKYNHKVKVAGGREKLFEEYDEMCQKYNNDETGKVADVTFNAFEDLYWTYNKEGFLKPISLPFEDVTMLAPSNYDEHLKETFGNYMDFVKGTTSHGVIYFDKDNDYKKYDEMSYSKFKKLFK